MYNFYRTQIITLIYSWAFALIYMVLGGSLYTPLFIVFFLIYSWIPAFVALQFYHHEKIRFPLKFRWKTTFIWPILIAIALFLFNMVLILPFLTLRSTETLKSYFSIFFGSLSPLISIVLAAFTVFFLSVFVGCSVYFFMYLGSEIMWRGYAWEKIKTLGFWKASLLLGVIMGIWRAPLVLMGLNYPLHPYSGLVCQILFTVSITPLALYYRIKTHSIFGSVFFIGVYFAYTDFIPILFNDTQSLFTGSMGLINIIALNVFNVLLCVKMHKNPLLEYEI